MGIDLLDVVFRLEREFQIKISARRESVFLMRVGWIQFLVTEKLGGRSPAVPDVSAVYRRVGAVVSRYPDRRGFWGRTFDQRSRLSFLLTPESLPQFWCELEDELGFPLPRLCREPDGIAPLPPAGIDNAGSLAAWIAFTCRDVVPHRYPARPSPRPPDADRWTDEAIFLVIRAILVDALSVNEEDVTPEAWLIEDLGAE
jgi:acyl carrier protein